MISVIVPNYNYRKYLGKRLKSIVNQGDIIGEIIFLDDSSTDSSVEYAKKFLSKTDIEYKIVTNDSNSGSVYRQWEKGISLAKYKYIWIAEADDYCSGIMAGELYKLLESDSKLGMVYCESSVIDFKGKIISHNFYKDIHKEIDRNKWLNSYTMDGKSEISGSLVVRNTIPNVSGVLFRASILKSVMPIDSKYTFSGDWLTYIKILEISNIGYISKNLNYHRQHSNRVTARFDSTYLYYKEAIDIVNYIKSGHIINSNVLIKSCRNYIKQASLTGSLTKEIIEILEECYGKDILNELLMDRFNKLSLENISIKKNLLYRFSNITPSKLLKRIKGRI